MNWNLLFFLLFSASSVAQNDGLTGKTIWLQKSYVLPTCKSEIFTHDSWYGLDRAKMDGMRTSIGIEFEKKYFDLFLAIDHESYRFDYEYSYSGYYAMGGEAFGPNYYRVTAWEGVRIIGLRVMPGIVLNPKTKKNKTRVNFGFDFLSQYHRDVKGGSVYVNKATNSNTNGTYPANNNSVGISNVRARPSRASLELMLRSDWKISGFWNIGVHGGLRMHSGNNSNPQRDWIMGLNFGYTF